MYGSCRKGGRASGRALRPAAAALVLALSACGGTPGPTIHTVEINAFAFLPASLEVAAGDTIVWINRDIVPHTATSAQGGWDTGSIAPGDSGRIVAAAPAPDYLCVFHPTMRGALVLR